MTFCNSKTKPIVTALVWAALMIAVSFFTRESDNSQIIIMLMIGGWIATGGLSKDFHARECRAFNRLIGKGSKTTN